MGSEQSRNHRSRPPRSGCADRLQRLEFRLDRQSVPRLGFDCGRSHAPPCRRSTSSDLLARADFPALRTASTLDRIPPPAAAICSYEAPSIRFSKSTSRGLTKTGCVWESTNPGSTTLPGAIDLDDLLPILFHPRIARSVFGRADGHDLAAEREDSSIFDNAEFLKLSASTRARIGSGELQSQKLADVGQEKW